MPIGLPSSPTVGQVHPIGDRRYRWNGEAWIIDRSADAFVSATEPATPYEGQLWANPTSGQVQLRLAGVWQDIGGGAVVVVADTPPVGADPGTLWVDAETGVLSVRLPGGWAVIGGPGVGGAVIHYGPDPPASPQVGVFWLDPT